MIIGGDRSAVIENIKKAASEQRFNDKVEIGDPDLTEKEKLQIFDDFFDNRTKAGYLIKCFFVRRLADIAAFILNRKLEIKGVENYTSVKGGAMITCNHYNHLDSTVLRYLVKKYGNTRLYTASQDTNFAIKGAHGLLMKYADTIPVTRNLHRMKKFELMLSEHLKKGNQVLIYPEQEMWFNYKKPRPVKDGAYYYAAKLNVPVISCFTEMQPLEKNDNGQFKKVKLILHVLPPIFPDESKNFRENSVIMRETDEKQKREAFEKAYGKELVYDFDYSDIAGYIYEQNREEL